MARITIEDCIEKIPNRFELVLLAAQRAHGIYAGDNVTIPSSASSVSVIALKEIAAGHLNIDKLRESFILKQQETNFDIDDTKTKDIDIELVGVDIIQNEEQYDTNYDLSDVSFDNNFDNILLEKD